MAMDQMEQRAPRTGRPAEGSRPSCFSKINFVPEWNGFRFTRGPPPMSDVSRILSVIEHGDPAAAGQLLLLV
jgi:hypothetical protein